MKKIFFTIGLIILLFYSFLLLDKRLLYYGRNDFNHKSDIPFNIQVAFFNDFEGGVYITDNTGLSLITKGKNHWITGDSLVINRIIGYAFNQDDVIAKVENNDKRDVLLRILPSSKGYLTVKIIGGDINFLKNYKWIYFNQKFEQDIYIIRNWDEIIVIILFIIFIYQLIRFLKHKKYQISKS